MISRVEAILGFWFQSPESPNYGQPQEFWFIKNPKIDEEIRTQFLADYEQAAKGKLENWQHSPLSCLALILLLDQFSRNLFRGTPQAFATDSQALKVAQFAVASGYDRELLPVQRWFIYLPFEHAEDLQIQYQSVALFEQLRTHEASADAIDYAIRHCQVIEQFGRFPHRNAILGRESTSEEVEFLKQPGSSF